MMPSASRVVQATNVAPTATKEQMKTLFGFLGRIDDLVIYPSYDSSASSTTKVCYVKYDNPDDVNVALHLTNTVFIDRALNVVPVPDGRIPDEKTAIGGLYALKLASPDDIQGDEVERTVYVANLDSTVAPETLIQFFGLHGGEVKYARMAGDESFPVRAAFIEFTEKPSVNRALALTGQVLGSRPITVVLSNSAIVKVGVNIAVVQDREDSTKKSGGDDYDSDHRSSKSRSHRRSRSRSSRRSHRSHSRRHSRSRSPRSRHRSTSRSPRHHGSQSRESRSCRSSSKSPRHDRMRSPNRNRRRGRDSDRYSPQRSKNDGYFDRGVRQMSRESRHKSSRYRASESKSPDMSSHRGRRRERDAYHDVSQQKHKDSRHDRKSGDKRSHSDS